MKIGSLFKSPYSEYASTSKIWFHIANTAVTVIYLLIGLAVAAMDDPSIESLAFLTLVYMGLVTGNKIANKVLDLKYGNKNENK